MTNVFIALSFALIFGDFSHQYNRYYDQDYGDYPSDTSDRVYRRPRFNRFYDRELWRDNPRVRNFYANYKFSNTGKVSLNGAGASLDGAYVGSTKANFNDFKTSAKAGDAFAQNSGDPKFGQIMKPARVLPP